MAGSSTGKKKSSTFSDSSDDERNDKKVTPEDATCLAGDSSIQKRMQAVGKASVKAVETTARVSVKSAKAVGKTVKNIATPNAPDYRWEELQRIEKKRRSILKRSEESFWKTLLHWDGTVFNHLKTDSLLWMTIAIYIAIRVAAREGLPSYVSDLDSGRLGVVGGFLTFFIVFFVNQTYKRFLGLYGNCMACKGRIFDTATLARTCMPHERALRLNRYMNAAHAAAYVGLSEVYPSASFFNHFDNQFQLLTPEERARIDKINLDAGGSAYRELIVWAMLEVQDAKDQGMLDKELAAMLREQVLKLRAEAGQLYNAADLPVPHVFVHYICLLTVMYLPLFAVAQGINAGTGDEAHWVVDVVAGLVVLLQSIFVIGLRVLGQQLMDPLGCDKVDFSVIHFVNFVSIQSNRVLLSESPSPSDLEIENDLARRRITVGAAWDDGSDRGLGPPGKEAVAAGEPELNTDFSEEEVQEDNESSNSSSLMDTELMRFGRTGGEKSGN